MNKYYVALPYWGERGKINETHFVESETAKEAVESVLGGKWKRTVQMLAYYVTTESYAIVYKLNSFKLLNGNRIDATRTMRFKKVEAI